MSGDEEAVRRPAEAPVRDRPDQAGPPAKVDPETLVLRGAPRRVARFRREIIIGVAAVGALATAVVTWIALEPVSFKLAASGDEMFEKRQGGQPQALAGTPGRYDEIPELGPPLPGDLGRPILEHQRKMEGAYPPAVAVDDKAAAEAAERERRLAEEGAARQSPVMMSLGSNRGTQPAVPRASGEPVEAAPAQGKLASSSKAEAGGDAHVSPHRIAPPASPWMLSSGSVIAASLITGLNSDLPGLVVAQVSQNTYDSITGRTLLIPQGARLMGRYESRTSYGQKRAFVVWQRIVWPDGSSLALDDAPASDPSGYAGLADRVDAHGWQLIKGVALATLLGVGTELNFGDDESEIVRAMRESAQQGGSRAGDRLAEKSLDIQPTIVVRPGWPVRVIVHKDIVLGPWQRGAG
ncbi:TraB/TrbI/VirB10 family type IV secretion system protein [Sphingopyxis sp. MSC1_008]|jgi:type IV secretory pathway VirB10-like protein|uniref:TrbI/VirB10 family protein n=1 Tax=Sphingopyxis sp. MSC1_008 TaxID=2909265 RepID=UPI0020BE9146|nr:TrbI/VirB10 family protein [Sphingopyxis sp. MSC1_008]